MQLGLSVILPANNEAALIGKCLESLERSTDLANGAVEVIVVANACTDKTVEIADSFRKRIESKGWTFSLLDLKEGGKLNALNAGDAVAQAGTRVYLDADVEVEPDLLAQLADALNTQEARYASGRLVVAEPHGRISRAYRRIYSRVPFVTQGVPGCGVFAVNKAGRKRWGRFPDIISDDTFVRLQFTPRERIGVMAAYEWPIVEGFGNLVRVRRRQDAGVLEIVEKYPELLKNDDKHTLGAGGIARLVTTDPVGFAVYAAVALAVRLTSKLGGGTWSRGR